MDKKQNYKSLGTLGVLFLFFALIWVAIGEIFFDTANNKEEADNAIILSNLRVELRTENIDSTYRYYVQTLGFDGKIEEKKNSRILILSYNDVKLKFKKGKVDNEYDKTEINLFISVSNIEDYFDKVTERTNKKISLIKNESGQLQFSVKDNNSHRLTFIEN